MNMSKFNQSSLGKKPDIFTIPEGTKLATPELTERENFFRNMRTWPEIALVNLKYSPIIHVNSVSNEGIIQLFIDTIPEKFQNPKILKAFCKGISKNGETEEKNKARLYESLKLNGDDLNPKAKQALQELADIIYKRLCSQTNS